MKFGKKPIAALAAVHVIFIILFAVFVDYGNEVGPEPKNETDTEEGKASELDRYFAMFQDVQVMMLIGFGFLMTFLKKHGFNSIGFNFLLTCFVIEWSLLMNGWFGLINENSTKIHLSIVSLLEADFAVATVLISFGAVLGVASPMQLLIMAFIEVIAYNVNILIGVKVLGAIDVGGSIFIHAFGAYYGLAVARMLYKTNQVDHENESSNSYSDLMAMIGTLFLWLYWPSFNAGPATGNERHRAVVNTVLSLTACTVVTFIISALVNKEKLSMVHIQNATLAGGVAMGASADVLIYPFGALLVGTTAAAVSTLGYHFLQPILLNKLKLHDTCGVHNLHGMPGLLGAIISAVAVGLASKEVYHKSYKNLFIPEPDEIPFADIGKIAAQLIAAFTALILALLFGSLTGFILKFSCFDNLKEKELLYSDGPFWDIEEGKKSPKLPEKTDGAAEMLEKAQLTKLEEC